MPKNITVSDIRKEAQKLIESGKMPPLAQLLGAVAFARQKYTPRIKAAQASGPEPEEGAPADFGGRVIPNPTGVKPEWDTAPVAPHAYPGKAVMDTNLAPLKTPEGNVENYQSTPEDRKAFPMPEEIER
jgi:hypothetical protein